MSHQAQKDALKRRVTCYPSPSIKEKLRKHKQDTDESNSELVNKLLKSFFAAKEKQGQYPQEIKLLP